MHRLPFVYLLIGMVVAAAGPARAANSDNAADLYRKAFATLPDTSDPEFAFLNEPDGVRLDDNAANYLKQHDSTFELLRQAATLPKCDWGTDLSLGTKAQLPHLEGARRICNLTRLRARWLFQQGRHAEALDDVAALLALSRRVGDEPFIVSKLIEVGVADSAVLAAENGLAAAPQDAARKFAEKIAATHRSMPAAEVVMKEGASVANELRALAQKDRGGLFAQGAYFWNATQKPGGAELREQVKKQWDDPRARDAGIREVAQLTEEVARHLALPFDQSLAPVQRWETKREAASPLARLMVPSMKTYRAAVAAVETRVEMMRVAALVRADGPAAAADSREPHADGPFTYRDLPNGGFELESRMLFKNQPLKVTCRTPRDTVPF